MNELENCVRQHYSAFGDRAAILAALEKRGIPANGVTPKQLSPFDQFHTGGAPATEALASLLAPASDDHVLDVGCGLGGPARMLSELKGCKVTGLDLAPHFIENARFFTGMTGQAEKVDFQMGSATHMPFGDGLFDAAWHLHVSMNVADKSAMYSEIFRVLKPGGSLAIHDPVRGEQGEVTFPVPWAPEPSMSHLVTREELLSLIEVAGFAIREIRHATAEGLAWYEELDKLRKPVSSPKPPNSESRPPSPLEVMTANHRANLRSRAVEVFTILARKPA